MKTRICRNHSWRSRGLALPLYFIRKSPWSGASHLDLRLLLKYLFSISLQCSHHTSVYIPHCSFSLSIMFSNPHCIALAPPALVLV